MVTPTFAERLFAEGRFAERRFTEIILFAEFAEKFNNFEINFRV